MYAVTAEEWIGYDKFEDDVEYDVDYDYDYDDGYVECPDCGGPVGYEAADTAVGIMSEYWFCEGDEGCNWSR